MLEHYFDKDNVKSSTCKPGDSFGMDLDETNFDAWRRRLPRTAENGAGVQAEQVELASALAQEFEPVALKNSPLRQLTQFESAVIEDFMENTIRGLRLISGDVADPDLPLSWSPGPRVEVESSDYRFSKRCSVMFLDRETGGIKHARVIVAFHQIMDKSDPSSDPIWLFPDLSGNNLVASGQAEMSDLLEPERFTSGPVAFVHMIRSVIGKSSEVEDAFFPRFSDAAFREAVEHFVAKYAGQEDAQKTFSFVEQLAISKLEEAHPDAELRISNIRIVESREQASIFHFALGVEVGEENVVEDIGVFLNANGGVEIERF